MNMRNLAGCLGNAELWLVVLLVGSMPAQAAEAQYVDAPQRDAPWGFASPEAAVPGFDSYRLPTVDDAPAWVPEVRQASHDVQPLSDPLLGEPYSASFTLDELREEMSDLAWTKGDYRIVPYGQLWGSAIYTTSRAAPGPFILYILSETDEGEADFVIDTRRTRLGLNIEGPRVPMFRGAKSSAQVEIDFHGVLGTVEGIAARAPENQTGLQMRHAFAEIKDDDFRLLAGQTWDVVSPLYPGMLTYAVGWGGGNIGFRRMQIRYERYLHMNDVSMVTLQGAISQDIVLDFIQYAESVDWPVLQGRGAWTLGERGPGCHPLTLGVSGHIGEQGFDFPAANGLPAQDDARIRTWSFNTDARWPITSWMGVQGEFFTGENLSSFLGGVIQGINRQTRDPIRSTGGWAEVWVDWTPRLRSRAGFGIDDPKDAHIHPGGRTENRFVFGNLSFDILPKLVVGMELSNWKTRYQDKLPGDAMVFEFTGSYGY